MTELTPRQIEHIENWLERFYSRAGESYEPEDDSNFFDISGCARALAPALALPDTSGSIGATAEDYGYVQIGFTEWQAHVAAVKAITGEAE